MEEDTDDEGHEEEEDEYVAYVVHLITCMVFIFAQYSSC
jgi:hypothetical protein